MSHQLADFLEELLHARQLVRVDVEVDAAEEIAEITRRVAAEHGPALLFDRIRGHKIPVVTNLLGTAERLCRVVGIEHIDQLAGRVAGAIEQSSPQNWLDRLRMSSEPVALEKFLPRVVKSGACQQVVRLGRDVKLGELPALACWLGQSGRTLSAARLVSDPTEKQRRTVALCRLQLLDDTRLAIVDDGQPAIAQMRRECETRTERLAVAIALGGDPLHTVAASLPGGPIDAYSLVGLLRGGPVELVKCRASTLEISADADLVLEGSIDPEAEPVQIQVPGLLTGHFQDATALVMNVAAITQRNSPILPAIVDGICGGEMAVLRKAQERLLFPLVSQAVPELVDYSLPPIGGLHNFAAVSICKKYAGQARKVASAVWGVDFLATTKFMIVVDEQVDVHDPAAVWAAVGANVDSGRDVFAHQGPGHATDHAASQPGLSHHLGFDATAKLGAEHPRSWPSRLAANPQIQQLVDDQWTKYVLTGGK